MKREQRSSQPKQEAIPAIIGVRTSDFTPLLKLWQNENRGIKWSVLLKRALKKELAPLAGKRYLHLVED